MSRKPKPVEERRTTVTFSLMPGDLSRYDTLLEHIKTLALQRGADEKILDKYFSRSAFLRELVKEITKPQMSEFITTGILAGIGFGSLYHQEELDLGDKKKGQA